MWTEINVLGRDGLAGVRQDGLLAFVGITAGLMIRGCWVARPKPWEVDDELWAVIEPLLPKAERRTRHPGHKWHPDRLVADHPRHHVIRPAVAPPSAGPRRTGFARRSTPGQGR
jgi:hypothetical protein